MRTVAKNERVPIVATCGPAPVIGPYADVASLYTGPIAPPPYQTTGIKIPIIPAMQDVRDVPIFVGFDFRKRVYAGI